MDSLPPGVPRTSTLLAGHCLPFHDGTQSSPAGLLLSHDGSSVGGDGYDGPVLGRATGLCLSPLRASSSRPWVPCVLSKVRQSRGLELTLVAPFWPQHPWFPDLLVEIPFFLPRRWDLLKQLHFHHYHQNLRVLQPTAISYIKRSTRHFGFSSGVVCQLADCWRPSTRMNYQAKWTVCRAWCRRHGWHGHSVSCPSVSKVADFLLYPSFSLSLLHLHCLLPLYAEWGFSLYVSWAVFPLHSSWSFALFSSEMSFAFFSCPSLGSVTCSSLSTWFSVQTYCVLFPLWPHPEGPVSSVPCHGPPCWGASGGF